MKVESFSVPIYVTRPIYLPVNKVREKITEVFSSGQLTNSGPQSIKLESLLKDFLLVPNISIFCNGTTALQVACHTLGLSGEVITTPFTFAATIHSLYWNRLTPVFCDIEPDTFNIDYRKIEQFITPKTTAIMPVHVFGYPCNIKEIQKIANRYKLKVIYDAAHCFGVDINGRSIASFGDASVFSFHATKTFHTLEGGAIVFKQAEDDIEAKKCRNFGFDKHLNIEKPGLNGKMNEVQAAIGILILDLFEEERLRRKGHVELYRDCLKNIPEISFREDFPGIKHNYYNFTICLKERERMNRDILAKKLKEYNVFTRAYFSPLINKMNCYKTQELTPVADKISSQCLSLPLYGSLKTNEIVQICDIIKRIIRL